MGGRSAIALLLLPAALFAGCRPDAQVATPRPPVILISLDTLRADALSAQTTPHLARLAAASVRFSSALTEVAFTLPAHMTMLTGSAPDVHGVSSREDRLGLGQPTLAEMLGRAGYATAAVVSSDWLSKGFGFGRGFDSYQEIDLGSSFALRVRRRALATLDRLTATGQPPFLFVHFYDAHSDTEQGGNRRPYWAPPEESAELPATCLKGACAPEGRCATGYLLWANHHPDEVSTRDRECLLSSYLAGVRALDSGVGELLAG
ncbi:MAG: sulfatase-like hydrolase/transferase, partial [Acidobacteria bacterium]|nr:sulfatase-like hydrolase/transferase [Acidobacteriota bacterium]